MWTIVTISGVGGEQNARCRDIQVVIDTAVGELKQLGAEAMVMTMPEVVTGVSRTGYDSNVFETEAAIDASLAQHSNAPVRTLRDLLLSGRGLIRR